MWLPPRTERRRVHWSVISLGGLVLGAIAAAVGIALWRPWLTYAGLLTLLLFALVDVGLALRHAIRRKWKDAFVASVLCLLTLGVLERAVMRQFMEALFENHDDFAEGLSIPEGLDLAIPTERAPDTTAAPVQDPWREAIIAALATPSTEDRTVVASLPSLCALASSDRSTLMRHFAASGAWRVYVDRGDRVAVRMLALDGRYEWTGGRYSDAELSPVERRREPFDTSLVVHLGATDAVRPDDTTVTSSASPVSVRMVRSSDAFTSTLFVRCGALTTAVFERSSGLERRLTKAALGVLEAEMLAVRSGGAATPRVGPPTFEIAAGRQGGMYRYAAHLNPGEPGTIHVRAYEVTRGTRLSAEEITRASSTHIGGSRDARETFPAQGEFMIGEGNWRQYYAARIEIWWRPDAGGRERKLIERLYRVEGWMR